MSVDKHYHLDSYSSVHILCWRGPIQSLHLLSFSRLLPLTPSPISYVIAQEVATLEKSYSESLHRLLRSSSYTFHSNLLFQWLGNDPYEEIGYIHIHRAVFQ